MNYNIEDALLRPFCVEEKDVKSTFLEWRKEKLETPLDIILKAKLLKIRKMYIPVRKFYDIQYQAKWKALSIWEHTEEYTEYETKIVYISKYGTECSDMGSAKEASDPSFVPQAVSKTVPVTKTRRVIDRTDWTGGQVNGSAEATYIDYSKERSNEFQRWIEGVAKKDTKAKTYKLYEAENKCLMLEVYGDDETAFSSLKEKLHSKAEEECKKQVPGNRFKEFSLRSFETDYNVEIMLLPVFQVLYSYCDKEYSYYVSGSDVNVIFTENYPIDNEFVEIKEKLTNELKDTNKMKRFYFRLTLIMGIIGLISGCGIFLFDVGITGCLISVISIIIFGYFYWNKKKLMQVLEIRIEELYSERINARSDVEQGKSIESVGIKKEEKLCPNCSAVAKDSAKFCTRCGCELEEKRVRKKKEISKNILKILLVLSVILFPFIMIPVIGIWGLVMLLKKK